MKRYLTILICFFFIHHANAQSFVNDAGTREKLFVYKVHQLDEFIKRFNDDTTAFIREVYSQYKKRFSVSRTDLVKSLFNYEHKVLTPNMIDSFTRAVTNKRTPLKLDFYREGLFAEANCRFQYNSGEIDIPVILRIAGNAKDGAKWTIAAVGYNELQKNLNISTVTVKNSTKSFINPASNNNNFLELVKAFEDRENLAAYFEQPFFERNYCPEFYYALLHNKIRLLHVKSVTYHVLQVDNWGFTIEYFPRQTLNSGWLINSLKRMSAAEKENYRKRLLGEN